MTVTMEQKHAIAVQKLGQEVFSASNRLYPDSRDPNNALLRTRLDSIGYFASASAGDVNARALLNESVDGFIFQIRSRLTDLAHNPMPPEKHPQFWRDITTVHGPEAAAFLQISYSHRNQPGWAQAAEHNFQFFLDAARTNFGADPQRNERRAGVDMQQGHGLPASLGLPPHAAGRIVR